MSLARVSSSPATRWGTLHKRFFAPRPSFKTLDDLNGWLADKCIAKAKSRPTRPSGLC